MSNKLIKYLGIDWGEKRIGLAVAESENKIATPLQVVSRLNDIINITNNNNIDIIIIGKPLKMQNIQCNVQKNFLDFLKKLKKNLNIPVIEIDERLSSKAADALIGDKKTKTPRDAIAAMLILQEYLDINKHYNSAL